MVVKDEGADITTAVFYLSFPFAVLHMNNVVLSLTQTQTKAECSKEADSTPPVAGRPGSGVCKQKHPRLQ